MKMDQAMADELVMACRHGHIDKFRKVVSKGYDVNVYGKVHDFGEPFDTPLNQTIIGVRKDKKFLERIEMMKTLLSLGANPNTADKAGDLAPITALFESCNYWWKSDEKYKNAIEGNFEDQRFYENATKMLFESGADPNLIIKGRPAFFYSYKAGLHYINMIYDCIKYGANLSAKDEDGNTFLMKLCGDFKDLDANIRSGDFCVMQKLIENGCDINATNKDGNTALMLAAIRGNANAVKILIEKGADVTIKNNSGLNVYNLVDGTDVGPNHRKIREYLLSNFPELKSTSVKPKVKEMTLDEAIESGEYNEAKRLLDKGAKSSGKEWIHDKKTKWSWTFDRAVSVDDRDFFVKAKEAGVKLPVNDILVNAIKLGNNDIIETMREMGATTKHIDMNFIAGIIKRGIKNYAPDTLEKIFQYGADVNMSDKDGLTPIIYAIQSGDIKLVAKLIECGANVNRGTSFGQTPAMWAAAKNKPQILELLIKSGADLSMKDYRGKSAKHYAREKCVELIKQYENEDEAKQNNERVAAIKDTSPAVAVVNESTPPTASPAIEIKSGKSKTQQMDLFL
jgi:ankyrin repeat protein